MRRLLPVMVLAIALLDAWLWWTGRISGVGAVAIFLAVEAVLAGLYVWTSLRQGIRPLPVRVFFHEVRAIADLWRVITRRIVVPAGAVALHSRRNWWHLPAMFTVAIVIEIIVIELLVPWPWLRLLLLVGSLYSLPLLWGYVAGRVVHPHYLGEDLVLREGRKELLRVPASEITAVRAVRGFAAERGGVDKQLVLGGSEGTNVTIDLADGRSVALWLDEGADALLEWVG
ncbi:hypothetical protein [Corynebacterium sp.]|uniref:hypothetical protein n=1 Tax=Corynebacterium sp. TaxID=1720 RepID=UPI0026E0A229|nr:hypothetical protein [Corynebacterium sp.]MDO5513159.1 hypothetical protein [Corynebacterium sp.]